jgi:pyruvate dehydrogenase E1 component beta subunit
VAALVAEKAFNHLKKPVRRLTVANCPSPVSQPLEKAFYPTATTIAQVAQFMLGRKMLGMATLDREDAFKGPY